MSLAQGPTRLATATELTTADLCWTLPSRDARADLLCSDDDIRWERDFFRDALTVAVGLLHETQAELTRTKAALRRERDQHRVLRGQLMREAIGR